VARAVGSSLSPVETRAPTRWFLGFFRNFRLFQLDFWTIGGRGLLWVTIVELLDEFLRLFNIFGWFPLTFRCIVSFPVYFVL
jgi:hypothetical protein